MSTESMTNSAVSIVVKTYFGILDFFPELIKMLVEYKTSSYYQDLLIKDIELTGNSIVVAADDSAVRPLEIKLQQMGIPFEMVPAKDFAEHIASNSRYLFLLREVDRGRMVEAANEVKKELLLGSNQDELSNHDEETELELDLMETSTLPETDHADESDQSIEESADEEIELGEGRTTNKKQTQPSVHRREGNIYNPAETPDVERGLGSEPSKRPQPMQGNTPSQPELHHTAERHESAQSTLNKSVDFHNRTVDVNQPVVQTHADGMSSDGGNYSSAQSTHSVSPGQKATKKAPADTLSFLGNGYDIENSQGDTQGSEYTSKYKCSGTLAENGRMSRSSMLLDKQPANSSDKNTGEQSVKDIVSRRQFIEGISSAPAINPHHESNMRERKMGDSPSATSGNKGNIQVINNKQRSPSHSVNTVNITNSILRQRRLHSVHDVLASRYFSGSMLMTRHTVTQSVISRETEAGQVANQIEDFSSPIGRLMKSKFLAHGAIALNKDIYCNAQIFSAAYAAKYGCDIKKAQQLLMDTPGINDLLYNVHGKTMSLWNLEELRNAEGREGFIGILNGLTDQGMANFLKYADISDELKSELLGYTKKALNDPNQLAKLMRKFCKKNDQDCLRMIYGSIIRNKFRGNYGLSALFQGNLVQVFKRIARGSEAGRAGTSIFYSGKAIYSTYRAGIRLTMTILTRTHVINPSYHTMWAVSDPVKAVKTHTFSVAKKAAGGTAKTVAKTQLGRRVGTISRGFSKSIMRTKIMRKTTSSLKVLAGLKQTLYSTVMHTKLMTRITQFGKLTAELAAKAGATLGWIAAIIIIIIIVLEIGQSLVNTKVEDSGSVNRIYVQDTEIIQEVIDELTSKNAAFILDISNAANHRGNYAVNSGFTADENVSFYETGAYHVIFRDYYGNELEPTHVDMNNTKAILSMASKFMPYPFTALSENASAEEKKAYEELKQHFKDYCNYLWASTHQITIEEYRPGDSTYSEVDQSALITELSTGKCDKDASMLWLPDKFVPNLVSDVVCESCQPAEATGLGPYSDDLCNHGNEKNAHGGWKMTGNSVQHINCPYGHTHHDDDSSWTEYCALGDIQNRNHIHTCYEWVYECGAHMGSVVYVTIGDLSRLPNFGAAGDVDYGAVGAYDTGDSLKGTIVTEGAKEDEME